MPKCNIAVAYLEILNTLLYWTHCYDVSTSKLSFIQFNAFVGLPTRYHTRIYFEQIYISTRGFVPRSKIDFTLCILTLKFTKIELKLKQRENVIQLKTGRESRMREFQGVSNSVSMQHIINLATTFRC